MTIRTFTLLSGGIDSSTTLARALHDFPNASHEAVTIDYGQRHIREAESAKAIASALNVEHFVVEAKGLMDGMLVTKTIGPEDDIPDVSYADLAPGISPTYVTFRNGLMLSILAARAQAWVMDKDKADRAYEEGVGGIYPETATENLAYLYCGVHADDGANWAYPDCTPEFVGAMANAIFIGTYHKVRLRTPIVYASKAEVVALGSGLGVPFDLTWSCYKGGDRHCGVCPTCRSRKDAFMLNHITDPTEYEA